MIKKCVLVDGIMEGGRPKPGDAVLVKSQGKLKDGRIIDDEPSMVFNIGDYEVIEGLDLVVQSMYKNELSIVSIKVSFSFLSFMIALEFGSILFKLRNFTTVFKTSNLD